MSRRTRRLALVTAALSFAAGFVLVARTDTSRPPAPVRAPDNTPERSGVRATERWRVELPTEVVGLPATDSSGVVVTTEQEVVAVSPAGQLQWRTPVAGALARAPRLTPDQVFVATADALVALARGSGAVQWRAPIDPAVTEDYVNRPALAGDVVVATAESGWVVGVDRASGVRRWTADLPTASMAEPAAGDGVVVVVGYAYWRAFAVASGAVLWSGDLGAFGTSSPVVYRAGEAWLAAIATQGQLIAVDLHTGAKVWSQAAEHSELYQVPVISTDNELLVPDHWGRLAAFDAATGAPRWQVAGSDTMAEFGEPVLLSARQRLVALPIDEHGPRLATPDGSVPLKPAAPGHGVARLPDGGLIVTTWARPTSFVLAYDIDVGD